MHLLRTRNRMRVPVFQPFNNLFNVILTHQVLQLSITINFDDGFYKNYFTSLVNPISQNIENVLDNIDDVLYRDPALVKQ